MCMWQSQAFAGAFSFGVSLARTILDPHVPMETSFLREERESLETGRGTRIYDTTGWSLPLEFGTECCG